MSEHYVRRPLGQTEHFATPLESLIYQLVSDREGIPTSREFVISGVLGHCRDHPDDGPYSVIEITRTLAVLLHKHFLIRR